MKQKLTRFIDIVEDDPAIDTVIGFTVVNHQDLLVASTVSFNLPPGVALGTAVIAIQAIISRIGMPASIHGQFSGAAKFFQQSLGCIPVAFGDDALVASTRAPMTSPQPVFVAS